VGVNVDVELSCVCVCVCGLRSCGRETYQVGTTQVGINSKLTLVTTYNVSEYRTVYTVSQKKVPLLFLQ